MCPFFVTPKAARPARPSADDRLLCLLLRAEKVVACRYETRMCLPHRIGVARTANLYTNHCFEVYLSRWPAMRKVQSLRHTEIC